MGLPEVWFVIVAILWTGFFFLEGFDFGVGMLARTLGSSEDERSQMLAAIGPVWTPTRSGSSPAASPSSRPSPPGTPLSSPPPISRCCW